MEACGHDPSYGRTTLSSVASFDMTPEHRLYFEGTYSHVDVKNYSQPAFGTYTIVRDNAYLSPSLAALMDANGRDSIDINRFDVERSLWDVRKDQTVDVTVLRAGRQVHVPMTFGSEAARTASR